MIAREVIQRLRKSYAPIVWGIACVAASVLAWTQINRAGLAGLPYLPLLPLALAAWFMSGRIGNVIAFASLALVIAMALPFRQLVESPSAAIGLLALIATIPVIIWLTRVQKTLVGLERRVAESKAALDEQMTQRRLLERELIAISEREQQRFGHELHDSLGQHLTGAAITAHTLAKKLKERPEALLAERLVKILEDGIELTRGLARGLYPVEIEAAGLMAALDELARTTQSRTGVACRFECPSPVPVADTTAAMHLFRIAQESVNNALKHARARTINLSLLQREDSIAVTIADDGRGFAAESASGPHGMGLRIMRHRAQILGAHFDVRPRDGGGTLVSCVLPPTSKP